jgi:hypothetical protein
VLWINGRTERRIELAATHAAWLMNCWRGKDQSPITAAALLGRQNTQASASDFGSVEEFQEYLREHGKE